MGRNAPAARCVAAVASAATVPAALRSESAAPVAPAGGGAASARGAGTGDAGGGGGTALSSFFSHPAISAQPRTAEHKIFDPIMASSFQGCSRAMNIPKLVLAVKLNNGERRGEHMTDNIVSSLAGAGWPGYTGAATERNNAPKRLSA